MYGANDNSVYGWLTQDCKPAQHITLWEFPILPNGEKFTKDTPEGKDRVLVVRQLSGKHFKSFYCGSITHRDLDERQFKVC